MPFPSPGHRPSHATGAELPRVLGFTSVVGILVGAVIGSGIFVAPDRIAVLVGSPQLILAGVPAILYWSRRRGPGPA
jgi:hypothetical protein